MIHVLDRHAAVAKNHVAKNEAQSQTVGAYDELVVYGCYLCFLIHLHSLEFDIKLHLITMLFNLLMQGHTFCSHVAHTEDDQCIRSKALMFTSYGHNLFCPYAYEHWTSSVPPATPATPGSPFAGAARSGRPVHPGASDRGHSPEVPLSRQSMPRAGFFSLSCLVLTSVSVWMAERPEFSASAIGITSRASANPRNAYCSRVEICAHRHRGAAVRAAGSARRLQGAR